MQPKFQQYHSNKTVGHTGIARLCFAPIGQSNEKPPLQALAKWWEHVTECYQTSLGDTIVFYDDSYEIVKSLRGKVKQYVVSNGTITAQTKKLRVSGLGELMDGIFLSEQLGVEKPDVHFFEQVFAQTGLTDKTQIMIVGDCMRFTI